MFLIFAFLFLLIVFFLLFCHFVVANSMGLCHSGAREINIMMITTTLRLRYRLRLDGRVRHGDVTHQWPLTRWHIYLFRPHCSVPHTGRPVSSRLTTDYSNSMMTPWKWTCAFNNNNNNKEEEEAVRVATQYAPAPLLSPWAPKGLTRRRADAT